MIKNIVVLFLLMWTGVTSVNGFAEIRVDEKTIFYQISPATADDIKFELREKSPISKHNKVFHGRTTWSVDPIFRWVEYRRYCYVTDVSVTLNTQYLMPKLTDESAKNPQVNKAFNVYYQALEKHEKGHQALGLQAAKVIEELLMNYAPVKSCRFLRNDVTTKINKIIQDHQKQNEEYDKSTGFGRTQGAVIR